MLCKAILADHTAHTVQIRTETFHGHIFIVKASENFIYYNIKRISSAVQKCTNTHNSKRVKTILRKQSNRKQQYFSKEPD